MSPLNPAGPSWRPHFHLTAPEGWINDPNGLVRVGGVWHLHYQYQTPRCWGHATSADLFHWQHLPVALTPDENGECWSGCTVEDLQNSSGLFAAGTGGLVSIYTSRDELRGQRISLAFSADGGVTWRNCPHNPILRGPTDSFRDPKVFWHEGQRAWIMVLTESSHFTFFASANLRDWRETGRFTPQPAPDIDCYDCPDLFILPVEGLLGHTRWILTASYVNGTNFDGKLGFGPCAQRYWIGDFDGAVFHAEAGVSPLLPLGAGPDDYAAIVWPRETDDARRTIMIGWMNHWGYAQQIPTQHWQGCLTLPRELRLRATAAGAWQLRQTPACEIWALPHTQTKLPPQTLTADDAPLALGRLRCGAIRMVLRPATDTIFTIEVFASEHANTCVTCDMARQVISFDRRESGSPDFHPSFLLRQEAPLALADGGTLDLTVIIDNSTVEVFAGDGAVYLSGLVFPDPAADKVRLLVTYGSTVIERLELREIRPAPPTIS